MEINITKNLVRRNETKTKTVMLENGQDLLISLSTIKYNERILIEASNVSVGHFGKMYHCDTLQIRTIETIELDNVNIRMTFEGKVILDEYYTFNDFLNNVWQIGVLDRKSNNIHNIVFVYSYKNSFAIMNVQDL